MKRGRERVRRRERDGGKEWFNRGREEREKDSV